MTTFSDPSSGGSGDELRLADVNGHLLIVRPIEYVATMETVNGASDAVRCDVADIDTNTIHRDVLWFARYVVGSLKGEIGKTILAQLGQGEAKAGKSAPWVLNGRAADPASTTRAEQWLSVNGATWNGLANPAAPAAAAVVI